MKRILIVEDDALLNKTLAYNLISDGWEVTPGGLLREVQEQPAVVVEILCRSVVLQHGEHGTDLPHEHPLTPSISRIRGKIEAEGDTYIKTIYGIGYQWTGGERK